MQIKKKIINNLIRWTGVLLITLFAFQILNKSLYIHTHKLADGSVIVHAHPYNKSSDTAPVKSHEHTQTEILFLINMKNLWVFAFLSIVMLFIIKEGIIPTATYSVFSSAYIILHKGRAPPLS